MARNATTADLGLALDAAATPRCSDAARHGHEPRPVHEGHDHEHDHDDHDQHHGHDHGGFDWLEAIRIVVAGLCAVALWFVDAVFFSPGSTWAAVHDWAASFEPWPVLALGDLIPGAAMAALPSGLSTWIDYYLAVPFSTFAAVGLVFGGWPIFREAFHDLRERRMTMELSMTIAILAAAYTGYFFAAMMVTFFVLVAEVLEGMTLDRGRRAIRDLLESLPREVLVRRGGAVLKEDTDRLQIGEIVLVGPGERLAIDGTVAAGLSFVDESRITGESMPVEKIAGSVAYAGSINQSGLLEIRVERIGADTSYGKIIEAVEVAERSRAPVNRLADRLAGYIVLFAAGFAALSQYLFRDVNTTISVLVVAGACGIAAGTPLAILGGIGRAARLGAIIKGGVHLEMLSRVDTIVFDKTGTLTFGDARVQGVSAAPGTSVQDILSLAASAELRSEHPYGKALVNAAAEHGASIVEPEHFAYAPGQGIEARVSGRTVLVGNLAWMAAHGVDASSVAFEQPDGASPVYVAQDHDLLGIIAIVDAIRPEARDAVARIHRAGLRTVLLTGDSDSRAQAVGRELGITDVEAHLMPAAKLDRIHALMSAGRKVAMVGDGINDAPALAAAHVGIAMGSGTDVARESADIVLIGNDLSRFADTLDLARQTRRIIWQNFVGTLVVDIGGIALAMMGFVSVIYAVQIHTGSELLFILNSARLLPRLSLSRKRGAAASTAAAPA